MRKSFENILIILQSRNKNLQIIFLLFQVSIVEVKKWWKQLNTNKKIPMLCEARKLYFIF